MSQQHVIEYRNPADLRAYEKNSRTHTVDQISAIAASIQEFGFNNPILLKDDGATIGAGHARCRAALEAGLDEVPTITLHGLSDAQWRAYVIADNQLAITGSGWDDALLRAEIAALADLDFDMPVIGFDADEIEALLAAPQEPAPSMSGNMAAEFLIPPFSVLNAREGWWQDRKRAWLSLGIKSEVGRGGGC